MTVTLNFKCFKLNKLKFKYSMLDSDLTSSGLAGRMSRPGEITEISGRRGLTGPPISAAVDSNTAISSSSSKASPYGEDNDDAMLFFNKEMIFS